MRIRTQILVGATTRNPCSAGVSARVELGQWGGLGHAWATNGLSDGVETVGGLVVEAVHQVPVSVDGDLDRGVPEPGLNGLGMFTGSDQPGGVRAAQIVDPALSGDRLGHGSSPDPPEGTPSQD